MFEILGPLDKYLKDVESCIKNWSSIFFFWVTIFPFLSLCEIILLQKNNHKKFTIFLTISNKEEVLTINQSNPHWITMNQLNPHYSFCDFGSWLSLTIINVPLRCIEFDYFILIWKKYKKTYKLFQLDYLTYKLFQLDYFIYKYLSFKMIY